jgi:eukaryotic-like serine/threonine-protein kinase
MIGQMISHYKILEKLGEGGMGIVYKAEDTKLRRTVALKFLPKGLEAHEPQRARFLQEAQAASALNHPNICAVHTLGEHEGSRGDKQQFIDMEFVEGRTLSVLLKEKELLLNKVIDIAIQICEGLNAAHRKGIVHRDIKPDNIMLTDDGLVKIMDFGLAKLKGTSKLTKTHSTLGTLSYMSPEQARGEEVDQRTDIFSLGAVLYEMITGRPPFKGDHEAAIIYSIINETPEPLARYKSKIPDELQRIVEKALSKERNERYQHVDELLVDLRSCSRITGQVGQQTQRTVAPTRKSKKLLLCVATASLIVLTLSAYFLLSHEEKPASQLKMIAVLPFENLGPAEDEYFADGLTDEITSRLSSINSLGVISRTSSMQYKKTSKSLPLVAKELGVDYILEGTIRWMKTGGIERIRITPQLINVSGDVHLWADNIDRTLDDIFAVQSEIAARVVKSLDIVLGEGEKSVIEAIPTSNIEAYQVYLQALSFSESYDPVNIGRSLAMFQRAIQLDSTFSLAYAWLSYVHLKYFWYGYDHTNERLSQAKESLDRAFAIQNELPEAYITLGYYYYWGYRDYERALKAFAVAEKYLPNNSDVLSAVAYIWRRQGKFEATIERLKKAFERDPKSRQLALEIGNTLWIRGKFAEAEVYQDRSISLIPEEEEAYRWKSQMYLRWTGDTGRSRSELDRILKLNQAWIDLIWLDIYERNYQSALNRLDFSPAKVSVEQLWIIPVSQMRGLVYRFMGDSVRSRASFDTARVFLESEIKKRPDDYRLHSSLGIVNAGLGRTDNAVREAELAVEQLPISMDAMFGVNPIISLSRVYVMVGKYDTAFDKLEFLLSPETPKYFTLHILQLDPIYDPLRNNPRYKALLAKGK